MFHRTPAKLLRNNMVLQNLVWKTLQQRQKILESRVQFIIGVTRKSVKKISAINNTDNNNFLTVADNMHVYCAAFPVN